MRAGFVLRWVLVLLGGALGAVLLAGGHVVVGGLILAMAVVRAVMLFSVQRRLRRWRRTAAGRGRAARRRGVLDVSPSEPARR